MINKNTNHNIAAVVSYTISYSCHLLLCTTRKDSCGSRGFLVNSLFLTLFGTSVTLALAFSFARARGIFLKHKKPQYVPLWLSFSSYSFYLLSTALVRDEALAITHSSASLGLTAVYCLIWTLKKRVFSRSDFRSDEAICFLILNDK